MHAPVALTFCAIAFWKNGWLLPPMPHTRTFKSRVARGADPWADMSEKSSRSQKPKVKDDLQNIILPQCRLEDYESTLSLGVAPAKYWLLSESQMRSGRWPGQICRSGHDRRSAGFFHEPILRGRRAESAREVRFPATGANGCCLPVDWSRCSRDGKRIPRCPRECCGQWRRRESHPALR